MSEAHYTSLADRVIRDIVAVIKKRDKANPKKTIEEINGLTDLAANILSSCNPPERKKRKYIKKVKVIVDKVESPQGSSPSGPSLA